MADAEENLQCWAAGARARTDLDSLLGISRKLEALTGPGEHDQAEVEARQRDYARLAASVDRDAEDALRCGGTVRSEPTGRGGTTDWVFLWRARSRGEDLREVPRTGRQAYGASNGIEYVVRSLGFNEQRVGRPGGPGAPRDVTLRMGPRGAYEFRPQTEEDLETAKGLETFASGGAKARTGVRIADYLYRDNVLQPSLSDELGRLRSILEAAAPGQPGGILITYRDDSRSLDISGYSEDPYRGSTWTIKVTPPYTNENQREIAEYVRRNEDSIAGEVQRLVPRKKRGASVSFYETHPGLHHQVFHNPEPGQRGGYEPRHQETG